jgi:hypothetical protein
MLRLKAQKLDVFIGEPLEAHVLSLYCKNGVRFAVFARVETFGDENIFVPLPIPPILSEDPKLLTDLTSSLADQGYILETPISETRNTCSRTAVN